MITQSELESRNPAEAIELTERSRAILQTLVDTNPGVDVFQERLAWSFGMQGNLSSNPVDALAAYAHQLAIM